MIPQEKLKVAVVGFGKRGIMQASMANINPEAEWKAVCDTNERLLTFMKNFYPNIPFFLDTDDMLDKVTLDTIFICTPDNTHLPLAKKLSKKDVNIFVESPLAESFVSATQMADLAAGRNKVYSIGYYSPFKVLFQQAKVLFDRGILDSVKRYRASLFCTLLQSRERKSDSLDSQSFERIVTHQASSFFFLIHWLFGPTKSLYAKASGRFTAVKSGVSLILDHSSGLMGFLDLSWGRPGYPLPTTKISVEGTGGTLDISDDSLKLYLYKKRGGFERGWTTINISDLRSPSRFFLCEEGYYEGNSSFIKDCVDRKKPSVSWEDGHEIMRMIEAVHLSIDLNRVIFLNEVK